MAENKETKPNPSTPLGSKEVKKAEKDEFFYKEEKNADGTTTVVYAATESDAIIAKEKIGEIPKHQNLTQALLGTPGMVDLTGGGTLNSDRTEPAFPGEDGMEEMVNELELTAGPNPLPNREGNEKLKMELGFANGICISDAPIASRIKKLRETGKGLNDDVKKELQAVEDLLTH